MDTLVELEGVNGEWFTLAGPGEGDRGVYLGTDVKGLYDPPVKVVYEEPGNYPALVTSITVFFAVTSPLVSRFSTTLR